MKLIFHFIFQLKKMSNSKAAPATIAAEAAQVVEGGDSEIEPSTIDILPPRKNNFPKKEQMTKSSLKANSDNQNNSSLKRKNEEKPREKRKKYKPPPKEEISKARLVAYLKIGRVRP